MLEHEKAWSPLTVLSVAKIFEKANFPWWIAGGYAIEAAVGNKIREHADIDVLVLRCDQADVHQYLRQWECWAADPPGRLRYWNANETLNNAIKDIWCRKSPEDSWRFQLMLADVSGHYWVSRYDGHVKASLDDITRIDSDGVHYLAPHIQLYYKAKSPRSKDQLDFDAVVGMMSAKERAWLHQAISTSFSKSHDWLKRLDSF